MTAAVLGDKVAVGLSPFCLPFLHILRQTAALKLMAQSLAGLLVSALIPSASCLQLFVRKINGGGGIAFLLLLLFFIFF